jgi:CxxC motif-containing protein (DUF1111 family)
MTTVFADDGAAFGHSARNLSRGDAITFGEGRPFFNEAWVIAPGEPAVRDGLGPTSNADSCVACHTGHGRGRVPLDSMDPSVGLVMRVSVPGTDEHGRSRPEPTYGEQLQDRSTAWAPHEGRVAVTYDEIDGNYGDGAPFTLRRPRYRVGDLQFGALADDTVLSPRLAPSVIGLGLLEAVPAAEILARADPDDLDGDGISGRASSVWDGTLRSMTLGRFGWKADQPSVARQAARALHEDLGVTSALFPAPNCPGPQHECASAPSGGEPEAADEVVESLVHYTRTLAVPVRRSATDPTARRGEQLFAEIGCAACHTASLRTGDDVVSGLRYQVIHPYTDLLLHDMGPDLADTRAVDGRVAGGSGASEWRTAPLWGIGLAQRITPGTGFMHDGRARSIAEAILWHGGEGSGARERFRTMPAADRAALLAFVESL